MWRSKIPLLAVPSRRHKWCEVRHRHAKHVRSRHFMRIALHAHGTTRRQVLLRAERIAVVDLNAAMSVEEAAIAAKYSIAVGGRMPVWCAHLARRINTRRRVWAQSLWRLPGIHVPCTRGGRGVAEMTFLDIRFDGNLTFFAITLWHGFDGRALCFLAWACWEGNLTRTLPAPNSEREE
jgi:hypothetical protein